MGIGGVGDVSGVWGGGVWGLAAGVFGYAGLAHVEEYQLWGVYRQEDLVLGQEGVCALKYEEVG